LNTGTSLVVRTATLPFFFFTRGDDDLSGVTIITTRETVHGFLQERLYGVDGGPGAG
jgi:hypothetical protein